MESITECSMFHENDSNQPQQYHWHVGVPHQSIGKVHEWAWQVFCKCLDG
jgi:hypothetical protein